MLIEKNEFRVKKSNVIAYINWLLDSVSKQNVKIMLSSIYFILSEQTCISAHDFKTTRIKQTGNSSKIQF